MTRDAWGRNHARYVKNHLAGRLEDKETSGEAELAERESAPWKEG